MTPFLILALGVVLGLLSIAMSVYAILNSAVTYRRMQEMAEDAARKRAWLTQYVNHRTRGL